MYNLFYVWLVCLPPDLHQSTIVRNQTPDRSLSINLHAHLPRIALYLPQVGGKHRKLPRFRFRLHGRHDLIGQKSQRFIADSILQSLSRIQREDTVRPKQKATLTKCGGNMCVK